MNKTNVTFLWRVSQLATHASAPSTFAMVVAQVADVGGDL